MEAAVKGGDDDDDKIQKISGLAAAAAGSKNASLPSMRDPNSILLWMGLSKGFDNKLNCMENGLRENMDAAINEFAGCLPPRLHSLPLP